MLISDFGTSTLAALLEWNEAWLAAMKSLAFAT
jgi:hypothetical protein